VTPNLAADAGSHVYFIGGTFGSGGSGWMIAIVTALVTSFATFWVGWLLEWYKRHRDRCALAETFIAEIGMSLQLFDHFNIADQYLAIRRSLQQQEAPNATGGAPADALTFPVTVYEKCADRIGTLGPEPAAGVVRFYNFLNGFRGGSRIALGPGAAAARIATIDLLLTSIAAERPRVEDLLRKLRAIADRRALVAMRLRKAPDA
jgi:hypothetical protein